MWTCMIFFFFKFFLLIFFHSFSFIFCYLFIIFMVLFFPFCYDVKSLAFALGVVAEWSKVLISSLCHLLCDPH